MVDNVINSAGLFGAAWTPSTPFNVADSFAILSGSGTISINGVPAPVGDAATFNVGGFELLGLFRTPNFIPPVGAEVSWLGDIIYDVPITSFNPGVYTTNEINRIPGFTATILLPLIVNIAVPEPSTAALIVFGGMLACWKRKR